MSVPSFKLHELTPMPDLIGKAYTTFLSARYSLSVAVNKTPSGDAVLISSLVDENKKLIGGAGIYPSPEGSYIGWFDENGTRIYTEELEDGSDAIAAIYALLFATMSVALTYVSDEMGLTKTLTAQIKEASKVKEEKAKEAKQDAPPPAEK